MFDLFDYQKSAIENVSAEMRRGNRRVTLCLPTGGGKTVIFCNIAKRAVDKGGCVIILTHRQELMYQAHKTLSKMGLSPTYFNANEKNPSCLTVAMVETAKINAERLAKAITPTLIIIDEAHIGNFHAVFDMWPSCYYIGVTATPLSANKKMPMKAIYNSIVIGSDIPSLIERGRLARATTYAPKLINTKNLRTKMGEYTDDSMMSEFDKPVVYDGIIDEYRKRANGKKALVFCVNIAHTLATAERFRAAGYKEVRSIDSTISTQEREAVLRWYEETDGAILCNCSILTTGFDSPSTEVVIVNRATKSVTLYLQMVGRGARVTPTKQEFIVIDAGECYKRCGGTWDAERDWQDVFHNPPTAKKGKKEEEEEERAGKVCPLCGAVIPVGSICRVCGCAIPSRDVETATAKHGFDVVVSGAQQKRDGKATAKAKFDRLIETRQKFGNKLGWVYYKIMYVKNEKIAREMFVLYAKTKENEVSGRELTEREASSRASRMMDDWKKKGL